MSDAPPADGVAPAPAGASTVSVTVSSSSSTAAVELGTVTGDDQQVTISGRCGNPDCKSTNASKLCGQCENIAYCSIECQRAHWKCGHKFDCEKKNTDPLISFSDAWLQVQEAMKQVEIDVAAKDEIKAIKLMKQTLAMAEHQFGRPDVERLRRVRIETGDSISSWEVDMTFMRLCTKLGDLNKALGTPDGLRNAEVFYLKARRAFEMWRKRLDGRGPNGEKIMTFDAEQENLILYHLARAELNIVHVLLDIGDVLKAEKHAAECLKFSSRVQEEHCNSIYPNPLHDAISAAIQVRTPATLHAPRTTTPTCTHACATLCRCAHHCAHLCVGLTQICELNRQYRDVAMLAEQGYLYLEGIHGLVHPQVRPWWW